MNGIRRVELDDHNQSIPTKEHFFAGKFHLTLRNRETAIHLLSVFPVSHTDHLPSLFVRRYDRKRFDFPLLLFLSRQ